MSIHPIALHWRRTRTLTGLTCQVIEIELRRPDRLMFPEDLQALQLPPELDPYYGVILSGRAPIWLYGWLVHACHHTRWVACYDPRLGAVVVSTHHPEVRVGQVLPLPKPQPPSGLAPAIMIVGPPHSGKSHLAHALFQTLLATLPEIYLQRAHWDGEGNWFLEIPDSEQGRRLKRQYRGEATQEFFPWQAQAILQLRREKQLVLVDVGGKVDPAKQPLLEACTHYLVVSRDPAAIAAWHEFCADRGNLELVGVVHTYLGRGERLRQNTPYPEWDLGIPTDGSPLTLPPTLVHRLQTLALPLEISASNGPYN